MIPAPTTNDRASLLGVTRAQAFLCLSAVVLPGLLAALVGFVLIQNDIEVVRPSRLPETGTPPGLIVASRHLHVGDVATNSVARASLSIENRGGVEYVVGEIKADCSCTVAEVVDRRLTPGRHLAIPITYRAGASPGPFRKVVSLSVSESHRHYGLPFVLSGNVTESPFSVWPSTLHFDVARGQLQKSLYIKAPHALAQSIPRHLTLAGSEPLVIDVDIDLNAQGQKDSALRQIVVKIDDSLMCSPATLPPAIVFRDARSKFEMSVPVTVSRT